MDKDTKTELDYLLPDKAYEILKWVALIALPAVAWLVGAVGVFVGALIGVSQLTATKPDDDSDKD